MTNGREAQAEILKFMGRTEQNMGRPATVREIAAHMGYRSTNTVSWYLQRMLKAGTVEPRGGGTKPRYYTKAVHP